MKIIILSRLEPADSLPFELEKVVRDRFLVMVISSHKPAILFRNICYFVSSNRYFCQYHHCVIQFTDIQSRYPRVKKEPDQDKGRHLEPGWIRTGKTRTRTDRYQ